MAVVASLFLLTGCGSGDPATTESGRETAALFQEGKGLRLPEETKASLGLRMTNAGPQAIQRRIAVDAQVFARRTNDAGAVVIRASAFAPADAFPTIPGMKASTRPPPGAPSVEGRVVGGDAATGAAFGRSEVVMEFPDPGRGAAMGSLLPVHIEGDTVQAAVAVPRPAVVRAALGSFVYLAEGEFLKRVAVTTGAEDDRWIELSKGPAAGQSVVTHGAEALWLLELSEVGGMMNLK